jgi:hypothetical protein
MLKFSSAFRNCSLAAVAVCGAALWAQTAQPALGSLPPELRAQATAVLSETNDKARSDLARAFAQKSYPAALPFLLDLMEHDASPVVRQGLIDRLVRIDSPDVTAALRHMAAQDPDAETSVHALRRLYEAQNAPLRRLLTRRLQMAKSEGDDAGYHTLALEDDRWTALERGNMLPAFLQAAPPVFAVKTAGRKIRVVVFGDYGDGSKGQADVAHAIARLHHENPLSFGITLGDNFYSHGVTSLADPLWRKRWEDLYTPLGIPFYASLGNHDWSHPDSPAAEILYTAKSKSWRMPASYYTYTAGSAQFFALDTSALGAAQLEWLQKEISKSQAHWKIVYGHHPIYSAGRYHDSPRMEAKLFSIIRNRATIYFAGHDHDMQALKPEDGVHFFVVGGGGASLRPIQAAPHSILAKSFHGFVVFEADDTRWSVTFYDAGLNVAYRTGAPEPVK